MILSKSQAVEKVAWEWLHGSRHGAATWVKATEECVKRFWLMTERRRSSKFQKSDTPPCVHFRLDKDLGSLSIY